MFVALMFVCLVHGAVCGGEKRHVVDDPLITMFRQQEILLKNIQQFMNEKFAAVDSKLNNLDLMNSKLAKDIVSVKNEMGGKIDANAKVMTDKLVSIEKSGVTVQAEQIVLGNKINGLETQLTRLVSSVETFKSTEIRAITKRFAEGDDEIKKFLTNALGARFPKSCPSEYHFTNYACFKIVSDNSKQITWDQAKDVCERDNSTLVHLESDAKRVALQSLMEQKKLPHDRYWIGGRKADDGVWRWDGVNTSRPMLHTNWASVNVDSTLLTRQYLFHLSTWLPNKRLRLLYRATRDGMSPAAFHSRCDNQGPTISVAVEPSSGTLFGGYYSRSWTSSGGFVPDDNAFIFQVCDGGCTTVKYDVKPGAARAVYHGHCVMFGDGDLRFFCGDQDSTKTNGYFSPNSLCWSTRSYSGHLSCSDNMKLRDVEVFAVEDDPGNSIVRAGNCMALDSWDGKWINAPCQDQHGYICEV